MDLNAFAAEIGGVDAGPVTVVGGRTQWDVGGRPDAGTREVRAPVGVVEHQPAELTVRVRAGTRVTDLDAALAEHGQFAALPLHTHATVGGVLAVGHSSVKRLGHGPLRDTVLEIRFVNDAGHLVKAGGPVVKNVSGFDLCRLFVGSLGTLGLIGEVVLRCRPRPELSLWMRGRDIEVQALSRSLFRPTAILWDGQTTWLCLEGSAVDIADQRAVADRLGSWEDVEGPPTPSPDWSRVSLRPSALARIAPPFLAQVGVGVVHVPGPVASVTLSPEVAEVHRRLKEAFDPGGRLNPGRRVS